MFVGGLVGQEKGSTIESANDFWTSLESLQGGTYSGLVVAAPEGDTTFRDKALVIHVLKSSKEQASGEKTRGDSIAIHLFVADDRSRTWVVTRDSGRLKLKHDHRHQDGTEDEITQYGGVASNFGLDTRQVFPADQHTADMLPAAVSNVWWMELLPGKSLTYSMHRLGTDRLFTISFDLTRQIANPGPAWGWEGDGK